MLKNRQLLLSVQQSHFSCLLTVGSNFKPFSRRLIIIV
jgi:hypothetical protein